MEVKKTKYYIDTEGRKGVKNLIYNTLASSAYLKANRLIIFKIGVNATIVMHELAQCYKLFEKKKILEHGNYFYAQYDFLAKETGLTMAQVRNAVYILEKEGIISTKVVMISDIKKRKYYTVNFKKIDELISVGDRAFSEYTEDYDAYLIYNKHLAKTLGPVNALIIADMITALYNQERDGHLDEDLYFAYKQQTIADKLKVTRQSLWANYMKKLKDLNLIETKLGGCPRQQMIKLNITKLCDILDLEPDEDFSTYINRRSKEGTLSTYTAEEVETFRQRARDGVRCSAYSQAQKEEFKRRAAEIEARGGYGVF